jgi:hypothetical protein
LPKTPAIIHQRTSTQARDNATSRTPARAAAPDLIAVIFQEYINSPNDVKSSLGAMAISMLVKDRTAGQKNKPSKKAGFPAPTRSVQCGP